MKVLSILLIVALLTGSCSCSPISNKTSNLERNLKEINAAIEAFAKLQNGTVKSDSYFEAEKKAVESLDHELMDQTSFTTFIRQPKGYDYLEETKAFNEKTHTVEFRATKQEKGVISYTQPIESLSEDRTTPYQWFVISEPGTSSYEPSGLLRMMAVPSKIISTNQEFIKTIKKETNGNLVKYTVTTSKAYAKYMREITHGVQENYIVREHRQLYWVDQTGLLVKCQSYDKSEWTIDGIEDTYTSEITMELTGYNYKNLILNEAVKPERADGEMDAKKQTRNGYEEIYEVL
ncbi:MAG: hypothetical protein K0Q48_2455 [Bacillota bacterium]|nr:hypothetical protein [Bacillota bacterium]